MSTNRIKHVAIVGAGGNSGRSMTEALLETGRFSVTALTRVESQNVLPKGVKAAIVDYERLDTIVEALQGQDALIVTLSPFAPPETQSKLIQAAGIANVPWILPNEWSPDTNDPELVRDVRPFQAKPKAREEIRKVGKSSYIAVCTGFWYEWSLAMPTAFGFNFVNRAVTFFDDGETLITASTWPQVGRAVAALLSLPIQPEDGVEGSLEAFRNEHVYIGSLTISQKDMFKSVLRVTNTTQADWTTRNEPSRERYTKGLEALKGGERTGFAKVMYSRVFWPERGVGNTEMTRGLQKQVLGLPVEDIDDATRAAIERSKKMTMGRA